MELDWCTDEKLNETENFNEKIVINKEKKIIETNNEQENKEKKPDDLIIDKCFDINLDIKTGKDLLLVLNYLSLVSNHLRTSIRNKLSRFNIFTEITENEYESIINYLTWIYNTCDYVKKFFITSMKRDNSFDPTTIKLFKTSSYKFCNFKESCSIHKNKNKCDKNHFVFEMIINDIGKLIDSIKIIQSDNINWVLANKIIKITYFSNEKKYTIDKITNTNIIENLEENQFIIDKTLIFKSFDVISYVLTKMYDEAFCFLNYDTDSFLINLNV